MRSWWSRKLSKSTPSVRSTGALGERQCGQAEGKF